MKILFIFHYCSPEINDIAGGPLYLASVGHDVLIVTARFADSLKGKVSAPQSEVIEGAEFFRPYDNSLQLRRHPDTHWDEVCSKVEAFAPDAVIGFGEFNYRLPLKLSRHFNIPYFVYMEYLRPEKVSPPVRGLNVLRRYAPALNRFLVKQFLKFLARNAEAFMFAYYGDQKYIDEVSSYGVKVTYVPWCAETGISRQAEPVRLPNSGIYIGSLAGFKNAAELVKAIPLLLEKTPTTIFTVVGPGEYAPAIKALVTKYPQALRYIESVPLSEAERLIRSADYAYTPVTDCGLGFIGVCWAGGTPLVTTHDLEGFLNPGVDVLVANGYQDLPRAVSSLLADVDMKSSLSEAGKARFRSDYSREATGRRYLDVILRSVPALAGKAGETVV